MMYYKKDGAIGVRRKDGNKSQIWSFGRGSGMSEKDLRFLGDECLNRLDLGKGEAYVYTWVTKAVSDWPDFQDEY